jgi:hypothetical protein
MGRGERGYGVFVLGDALGLWKEQNHMTGMSISALENGGINVFKKEKGFFPFSLLQSEN